MANRYSQPMIFQAPIQMYEEQVYQPDYGVIQGALAALDKKYSDTKELNKAFSPEYLKFKDHKDQAIQLENEMDNKFTAVAEAYKTGVVEGNRALAQFRAELQREVTNPNSKYNTLRTLKEEYATNLQSIQKKYEKDGAGADANKYIAMKRVTSGFNKEFSNFFDDETNRKVYTPGDMSDQFTGYTDVTTKMLDALDKMKEDEIESFMQKLQLPGGASPTDIIYTITQGGLSQEKIREAATYLLGNDPDIQAQLSVDAEYTVDMYGGTKEYIKSQTSVLNQNLQDLTAQLTGFKSLKDANDIKTIQSQLGVKLTGKMDEATIKAIDKQIEETKAEVESTIKEMENDPIAFAKSVKEDALTMTAIKTLYNTKLKYDFKIDNTRQLNDQNAIERAKLLELQKQTNNAYVESDAGNLLNPEEAMQRLSDAEEALSSSSFNLMKSFEAYIGKEWSTLVEAEKSKSKGDYSGLISKVAQLLYRSNDKEGFLRLAKKAGIPENAANRLFEDYHADSQSGVVLQGAVSNYVSAKGLVNTYEERAYMNLDKLYQDNEEFKGIVDEMTTAFENVNSQQAMRYLQAIQKDKNARSRADEKIILEVETIINKQVDEINARNAGAAGSAKDTPQMQSPVSKRYNKYKNQLKQAGIKAESFQGELVFVPKFSHGFSSNPKFDKAISQAIESAIASEAVQRVYYKDGKKSGPNKVRKAFEKGGQPKVSYRVETAGNRPILVKTEESGGATIEYRVDVMGQGGAYNTSVNSVIQAMAGDFIELFNKRSDGQLSESDVSSLQGMATAISTLAFSTGNVGNNDAFLNAMTASNITAATSRSAGTGNLRIETNSDGNDNVIDVQTPNGVVSFVRGGNLPKGSKDAILSTRLKYYVLGPDGKVDASQGMSSQEFKNFVHMSQALNTATSLNFRPVDVKTLLSPTLKQ